MKPSFVFLDKSVHVADAGIGLPSFCATRGGHSEESSLSNHALHPATGEAGGGDGAWTKTPAHTFTHTECSKLDGIEEVLSLFFFKWLAMQELITSKIRKDVNSEQPILCCDAQAPCPVVSHKSHF